MNAINTKLNNVSHMYIRYFNIISLLITMCVNMYSYVLPLCENAPSELL